LFTITLGEAAVLGVLSTVVVPVTVEELTVLLSAAYIAEGTRMNRHIRRIK
jgi:tetrahydrodipicolinate N-succinyltransferase